MRTIGLLLALLSVTCSPLVALAQCPTRKRVLAPCGPPAYVAPEYVAPVVVHAPAYVEPILTQFVPIAIPTYSVTYAPGEPYASENQALRQLVGQLQAQLQGGVAPQQISPAGQPVGIPNQGQTPHPIATTPGEGRPMPLASEPSAIGSRPSAIGQTAGPTAAVELLTARCARCHTGASSKGGMTLFDAPGKLSATFNRAKVIKACYSEKMPPAGAGAKLNDEEISQLIDALGQ